MPYRDIIRDHRPQSSIFCSLDDVQYVLYAGSRSVQPREVNRCSVTSGSRRGALDESGVHRIRRRKQCARSARLMFCARVGGHT
jgi:hypothetical protein